MPVFGLLLTKKPRLSRAEDFQISITIISRPPKALQTNLNKTEIISLTDSHAVFLMFTSDLTQTGKGYPYIFISSGSLPQCLRSFFFASRYNEPILPTLMPHSSAISASDTFCIFSSTILRVLPTSGLSRSTSYTLSRTSILMS